MAGELKTMIPSKKKRKLSALIHDSTKGKSKKLALLLPAVSAVVDIMGSASR